LLTRSGGKADAESASLSFYDKRGNGHYFLSKSLISLASTSTLALALTSTLALILTLALRCQQMRQIWHLSP
jgi:hypothetical protein